jgi:hypothetical protein
VRTIVWNGIGSLGAAMPDGSLTTQLPGAAPVQLPDLSAAAWRSQIESPESQPNFDDSTWQPADKTTTNSSTPPPAGQPVLTADDYGFHAGDVWYRGAYAGDATAATVSFRYGGGGAGMIQAWLDGVYLGQNVLATGTASPRTTGTATFAIPASLQGTGPHELSVMVRNDSHNEGGSKEGRGLISAAFADSSGAPDATPVSWKIQGDRGGENLIDPVRGAMNTNGLYGDRKGWNLPGFPDQDWSTASVPAASAASGTTWYRTTFNLDVPTVDDASLGLTIGNPDTPRSDANYRALIYVNGWNMGQYIANVGPQHTFVIPNGVLNPDGNNTLAIAVTSNGGPGNGLENVALTDLGTVRGGVPVSMNQAPSYDATVYGAS